MTRLEKQKTGYIFWPLVRPYLGKYSLGLLVLFVVDLINVLLPLIIKDGVDSVIAGNKNRVIWAAGLYGGLMWGQAIGRYFWRIFLIGTSHQVARDLRSNLYAHLQKIPVQEYHKMRVGDLMSRATNDVESVRMAIGPGILVLADVILIFAMIIPVMLFQSLRLSLLAFAFFPLLPLLTHFLGKRIDLLFSKLQQEMSAISAFAQENISAIRLVKSLGMENFLQKRFFELSKKYELEGRDLAKYQSVFSPGLSLLTHLGTVLILCMGGLDVIHGAITVGTFVAFQRFVVQLSWPMEAIGWTVSLHREGKTALERISQLLLIPSVVETRKKEEGGENSISSVTSPFPNSFLVIRALSFSYPNEKQFSLHIPFLEIQRGEKLALVGKVASGKTTLLNLLMRIYEPSPNTVWFQGKDLSKMDLEKLRKRISSVEQQVHLFSESITSNVGLGTRQEVAFPKIQRLAQIAAIQEEIETFPKKYDTELGEKGVNLSGGQKQRLGLMRALNQDFEMLLLDDCFSAVDLAVEAQILKQLLTLSPSMTVILATHRLQFMPYFQKIILMNEGKIETIGTHKEVLGSSALYQELWEKSWIEECA